MLLLPPYRKNPKFSFMKKSRLFYLFCLTLLLLSGAFWGLDYSQHGAEMNAAEHRGYALWVAFVVVATGVSYAVDKRRGTV